MAKHYTQYDRIDRGTLVNLIMSFFLCRKAGFSKMDGLKAYE